MSLSHLDGLVCEGNKTVRTQGTLFTHTIRCFFKEVPIAVVHARSSAQAGVGVDGRSSAVVFVAAGGPIVVVPWDGVRWVVGPSGGLPVIHGGVVAARDRAPAVLGHRVGHRGHDHPSGGGLHHFLHLGS